MWFTPSGVHLFNQVGWLGDMGVLGSQKKGSDVKQRCGGIGNINEVLFY